MAKKANLEDGRTITAEEEANLPKKITDNKIYICEKCGCRLRLVRLPGAPYFAEFSAENPHAPDCDNNRHRPAGQRGGRAIAVATNNPDEIDVQEVLGEIQLPVAENGKGNPPGHGGNPHGGGAGQGGNNGPRTFTRVRAKIRNAIQMYVTLMALGLEAVLHGGILANDIIVNTRTFRDYLGNPATLEGIKIVLLGRCYGPIAQEISATKPEGAIDWTFCLPFRCADADMIYVHVFFDSWEVFKKVKKRIDRANQRNQLLVAMGQWTYSIEAGYRVISTVITGEDQINILDTDHSQENAVSLRMPYREDYTE